MSEIDQIILDEVRLNRKAITKLDEKFSKQISKLDKQVFSNKLRLGIFIAGLSILFNIIVMIIIEKVKILLT